MISKIFALVVCLFPFSATALAQRQNFELDCPVGTVPINAPGQVTFNSVTGQYRQQQCLTPAGNIQTIDSTIATGPTTFNNPCSIGGRVYVSTGGCYQTIPQAIAAFAGGNCGTIYLPVGTQITNFTINSSNACSSPASQMILQGAGRRTTILKPASNAAVITLDSTSAPIQGVVIRDVGFDNTGTGFNQPAITIQGSNINDWHEFRRLRTVGFKNSINITDRK